MWTLCLSAVSGGIMTGGICDMNTFWMSVLIIEFSYPANRLFFPTCKCCARLTQDAFSKKIQFYLYKLCTNSCCAGIKKYNKKPQQDLFLAFYWKLRFAALRAVYSKCSSIRHFIFVFTCIVDLWKYLIQSWIFSCFCFRFGNLSEPHLFI